MAEKRASEKPGRALVEEIDRLKSESARLNVESIRLRQQSVTLVEAIERLEQELHHPEGRDGG